MEIKEKVIEIRTSRNKTDYIEYFVNHPSEISSLYKLVGDLEEYPYKEYASWVLVHLCKSERIDLKHLYNDLVDITFCTNDQTVLRNVINCINELKITEYRESEFIDLLISFVQNHENKVALHVYSIYILIQFCIKYPELSPEIKDIIELNREGKSAAYCIARRNFLLATEKK